MRLRAGASHRPRRGPAWIPTSALTTWHASSPPQLTDKRANVAAVIQEIFEKDIRGRVKIENVSVFNQVRDYVINNFGATTSLASIQSDLESKQGVRAKRETLARRVARSASGALESWNATLSSGTRRWATHAFRSQ